MKLQASTIKAWNDNYAEAKAFYETNGHFPTYKENRKLRQWARKIEKGVTLSCRQRLQLLTEIGYEPRDRWELWENHYRQAKQTFELTGKAPTHTSCPEAFKYFKHWISNSGERHPERMERLAQIGFRTVREDRIWEKNYSEAKSFFDTHNRFPTAKENVRLFMWARSWMQRYAKERPDLVALLGDIGFPA